MAIGNAHGFYIAEPKLDLDLLAEVRRRIEVPLVLNGGSGIPVDQVQKAIGMGVAKMNVGTAIHEGLAQAVGAASSSDGCQPREQLVTCEAPAYRVGAGSVASDVCCQIAAKNDQVPFVITSKGTLTRALK